MWRRAAGDEDARRGLGGLLPWIPAGPRASEKPRPRCCPSLPLENEDLRTLPPHAAPQTRATETTSRACRRGSTHRLRTRTTPAGTPACFKRTQKATKPRPLKTCLQTLFFFFFPASSHFPSGAPSYFSLATSPSPKGS